MDMEQEFRRLNEAIARITERLGGPVLPMVLTRKRAALELSISCRKLRQLIKEGVVLTVDIGRSSMIPSSEVERMARPTPVQQTSPRRAIGARPRVRVQDPITGAAAADALLEEIKRRRRR